MVFDTAVIATKHIKNRSLSYVYTNVYTKFNSKQRFIHIIKGAFLRARAAKSPGRPYTDFIKDPDFCTAPPGAVII